MHLHKIELEAFRKQPQNEVNALRVNFKLYQSPLKYEILETNWTPPGAPEGFEPVDKKEIDWENTKYLDTKSWLVNLGDGPIRTTALEGSDEYKNKEQIWLSYITNTVAYRVAIDEFTEKYFQEAIEDAS